MNKVIPLGLMVSALLTGCGGGSDGGSPSSGGGATPTTYTWQFVQLKTMTAANMATYCGSSTPTIFATDTSATPDNFTFAAKAPLVESITVYNSDGSIYTEGSLSKDSIDPVTGALSISANDVPDGGYISVYDKETGVEHNVLTIQKELLSNLLISVQKEQGNQQCYTESYIVESDSTTNATLGTDSSMAKTAFESYFSGKSTPDTASAKSDIKTITSGEDVLFTSYDSADKINGYAFVASSQLPTTATIMPLTDTLTINIGTTAEWDALTSVALDTVYKNQTYSWFDWSTVATGAALTSSVTPISSSSSEQYSTRAIGTRSSWNIESVNKVASNSHSSTGFSGTLNNVAPTLTSCSASVCSVNTSLGMNSTNNNAYRISYSKTVSSVKTNHAVYSIADTVNLPLISGIPAPVAGDTVYMAAFDSADDLSSNVTDVFMARYSQYGVKGAAGTSLDAVSVLTPPANLIKEREVLATNSYSIIER